MPDDKTMKIEFTEPRRVLDHAGKVIQKFSAGEVVELSEASARHWLNRNVAKVVGGAAAPEPEPRPEGDALMAAIAAAIDGLDPKNDFTRDGLPALADALGYPSSAAERTAAWATLQGDAAPT
jgi:hypothetical protein